MPIFLQLRQLLRIFACALNTLGFIRSIGFFDLGQRDFFFGVVRRADVGRALEGPVLPITYVLLSTCSLLFKGTPDIGTTDYAKEKVALQKVEEPTLRMRPSA